MDLSQASTLFSFISDERLSRTLISEFDFLMLFRQIMSRELPKEDLEDDKLFYLSQIIKKESLIKMGSIVEALIFHTARTIQLQSRELKGKKQTEKKVLYEIEKGKRIISQIEYDVYLDPDTIDFRSVIETMSRLDTFPDGMRDLLHRMRKMRNGVHIHDFLIEQWDFHENDIEASMDDIIMIVKYCKFLLTH